MSRILTVAAAQLGAINLSDTRQSVVARMIALMEQAEARGGIGTSGRTSESLALVMPPPRTMSTLAISMMASTAGLVPVVSMSMTRIKGAPSCPLLL